MSPECICRPVFGPGSAQSPALWRAAGFRGQPGDALLVEGDKSPVLLVGFGEARRLTIGGVREAAALAGRHLKHLASAEWEVTDFAGLALNPDTVGRALAEGSVLGAYSPGSGTRLRWSMPEGTDQEAWRTGLRAATATAQVRDLVNCPPNLLTPSAFADHCTGARDLGLSVQVRTVAELEELGMGGILSIGRGSAEPPLLVEITHPGAGRSPALSLVGKGVTFDSGGLSLKPAEGMIGMKHDMAGAATVLGAMTLLPTLAPALHVKAYLPVVENLPGPDAARPGDVIRTRNGRTVEILNTDFEGRVILADALALASEDGPGAIIDVATLTHAAVHALGDRTAALLGTHEALVERITAASKASDEPVWRLPMPDYLRGQIISDIADYKNFPGVPTARALTAALFLSEFVPAGTPWAHLDIAGPAWATAPYGMTAHGGTGFGVRLLAEVFKQFAVLGRLPNQKETHNVQ